MLKKKIISKKAISMACVFSLIIAALAGCGGGKTSKTTGQNAQNEKSSEPLKLSILTMLYTDPPTENNRILKAVQDKTNCKLDITWAPSASYNDKFSLTIASGQMPMATLISDDRSSAYINACKQGAFWDLTPYLKDYPNIVRDQQQMWDNAKVDGKNFIIPRNREIGRAGIMYRSDWLKNLGMKEPTTLDELGQMIKAFTFNDPDKNGKNDTFGLILDQSAAGVSKTDPMTSTIASYFGASTTWGVDSNGKVHPAFEEKEYIDSLKWLRDLYQQKCINQDFAVVQDIKALYAKGNAGTYFGTNDDIQASQIFTDLPKNVQGATTDALIKINGPKGIRAPYWGSGYAGGYAFAKSAVKTEADLKRVLEFYSKYNTKEVYNLTAYGEEGVDYKLVDGKVTRTDEQKKTFTAEYGSLGQLSAGPGWSGQLYPEANKDTRIDNYRAEVSKFVVVNPVLPIISNSFTQYNSDLTKMVLDARVKFIMGSIDEAGYNDIIKKWHSSGGDAACAEFSAEYAKTKK